MSPPIALADVHPPGLLPLLTRGLTKRSAFRSYVYSSTAGFGGETGSSLRFSFVAGFTLFVPFEERGLATAAAGRVAGTACAREGWRTRGTNALAPLLVSTATAWE